MTGPAISPDTVAAPAQARVTVDLAALLANYRWARRQAAGAQTGTAVKANSYGLGMGPCARALAGAGCTSFFVASAPEAVELRRLLPEPDIYVLNGPCAQSLASLRSSSARPVLNSMEQASLWAQACPQLPCDVMVDTGMNRLGLPLSDIPALRSLGLTLDVVMSHLACADEPEHPLNARQLTDMRCLAASGLGQRYSLANSAGLALGADYAFDLVRPGLALYGGLPTDGQAGDICDVARVQAQVVQVRTLAAGATAGYNATWQADGAARLAVLAMGYADGYPRSATNSGWVTLGGVRCPVAGRVSMDLITVDITAAGPVQPGDWADIMGGAGPRLSELAALAGRSQYELLTGLGGRAEWRYTGA